MRAKGVDLVSVTAWSLLGSHDWNRMVTRFIGHYETGVFDVRTGTPRPTLLAPVLKELSEGCVPILPAIAGPGWWQRETRLVGRAADREPRYEMPPRPRAPGAPAPLMIVTDGGDLSCLAVRACETRGLHYVRCGAAAAEATLAAAEPWAVLDARDRHGLCGGRATAAGTDALAAACAARGLRCAMITGAAAWDAPPSFEGVLEIRSGRLFAPWDAEARAVRMLKGLEAGRPVEVDAGAQWTSVYGPDLVDVTLDLLLDGVTGAVHVPAERMLEGAFARALALVAAVDEALVVETGEPAPAPLFGWKPPPSYLPPCESMVERFVREARAARRTGGPGVARRADETRLEPPAKAPLAGGNRAPVALEEPLLQADD
ncbi:MAG TPA: hypothetical protein VF727_12225 [Allosphingosinicella sp.]